jgi:hypothetical protein
MSKGGRWEEYEGAGRKFHDELQVPQDQMPALRRIKRP